MFLTNSQVTVFRNTGAIFENFDIIDINEHCPPSAVPRQRLYRLLKAHDLITSPAYLVIKAADQFHTKTTRPNEMWQTDFTYFKIIGWGWMYLSTVLDDFSWLTSSLGSCAPTCPPRT